LHRTSIKRTSSTIPALQSAGKMIRKTSILYPALSGGQKKEGPKLLLRAFHTHSLKQIRSFASKDFPQEEQNQIQRK